MRTPPLDPREPAPARWVALALSVGLHAVIAALGLTLMARSSAVHAAPRPDRPDAWVGETFDIDGLVRGAVPAAEPAPAPPAVAAAPPAPARAESPTTAESITPPPPTATADPAPAPLATAAPSAAKPKRRHHVHHRPAPAPVASSAAPAQSGGSAPDRQPDPGATAAASASAATTAASGTFGAAGLAPGVRDLGKAFTRALPRASSGDPLWSTLPVGDAGTFHVVIRVDDAGHLGDARAVEDTPPPQLAHLLARTVMLLRGGLFALSSSGGAGSETLRISVTISAGTPSDDIDANPADTVALGFDPPRPGKPGRGWFTLASGRHVEARVAFDAH